MNRLIWSEATETLWLQFRHPDGYWLSMFDMRTTDYSEALKISAGLLSVAAKEKREA